MILIFQLQPAFKKLPLVEVGCCIKITHNYQERILTYSSLFSFYSKFAKNFVFKIVLFTCVLFLLTYEGFITVRLKLINVF